MLSACFGSRFRLLCLAALTVLGWVGYPVLASAQYIRVGSYHSWYWTSDSFDGEFMRDFQPNDFNVWVTSTTGGFDAAVIRAVNQVNVDQMHDDYFVHSEMSYSGDGSGRWWYGPKLNVGAGANAGGYENYVVENSSRTPDEYHEIFTSDGSTEYLGFTVHDGGVYRHYRKPFRTWTQYWAIRTVYRFAGSVSMKRILEYWRANGLPNESLAQSRVNVETSGNINHAFRFTNYHIPGSFNLAPNLSYMDEDHSGGKRLRVKWVGRYLHAPQKADGVEVTCFDRRDNWTSQVWDFIPAGASSYFIQNRWTQRFLSGPDSGVERLTLEPFTGGLEQLWTVGRDGDEYRLISHISGQHIHGNADVNGGPVLSFPQRDWTSQKFIIEAE